MGEIEKMPELISGDKLYQRRARAALPLLVRQAQATRHTIHYSTLASELGMPNPRNLNYPLGHIGRALRSLSDRWGERIPEIQGLVVNKQSGAPGEGVGKYAGSKRRWRNLSHKRRQEVLWEELHEVFRYSRWPVVLEALGLSENYGQILKDAGETGGGGESEQHRKLKEYVAEHPEVLPLLAGAGKGTMEFVLPSGDKVDVLFRVGDHWHAVEVKSAVSDAADIARGIFQCVKYRAVIAAFQAVKGLPQNVRVVLVTEGPFPADLIQMRQILGVEVLDGIRPR